MRKVLVAAAAALLVGVPLAPSVTADLKPGGFMSSNVDWVANIPIDSPGVGARVVRVGAQTRFYVTGSKGLTIYDVTNPTLPLPMGTLPLPHWENEDVEVSDDGTRVIVSEDIFGPTYIIDTTTPAVPRIAKVLGIGAHTTTCVDPDCDWVYSSEGDIYDLRDLDKPRLLLESVGEGWENEVEARMGENLKQRAHDLNQDAAGLVVTDTMPRLMLDVSNPEIPVVKARSAREVAGGIAFQHNNLRPNATAWTPNPDAGPYVPGQTLAPGEILYGEGETNLTRFCNGQTNGPFATWSLKNWDKGQEIKLIDVYRPVNGNWMNGNPAVNVLGCSGHWFSERGGIVAAGWYEHGTRFLTVDNKGHISEVGFFQPIVGSASAAHWVSDDVVYVVDYARGIDILTFDRSAPAPSQAQITESWLAKLDAVAVPAASAERFSCRLASQ